MCIFGFIIHTLSCTLRLFQLGQLNKQLKVHFAISSLDFLSNGNRLIKHGTETGSQGDRDGLWRIQAGSKGTEKDYK